ncbi:MAG: hypothetical protein JW981_03355 [Anaerolineae bacterium]|nr:hypothetical protein [Anaerolineae bacterium]
MQYCNRCGLPGNTPHIQFNHEAICQFCQDIPTVNKYQEDRKKALLHFETRMKEISLGHGPHCLVSWNGGQHNSYLIMRLKEEYNLDIVAYTLDNGFNATWTFESMRALSESLAIDHIIIKPRFSMLKQLILSNIESESTLNPDTLTNAGICRLCKLLIRSIGLRLALQYGVSTIIYGWPTEIDAAGYLQTTPQKLHHTLQKQLTLLGETTQLSNYLLAPEDMKSHSKSIYETWPLSFLDYDEKATLQRLNTLGWHAPYPPDSRQPYCWLKDFANYITMRQTGYNPYALEVSQQVRQGRITREEGTQHLQYKPSPEVIAATQAKLGIFERIKLDQDSANFAGEHLSRRNNNLYPTEYEHIED